MPFYNTLDATKPEDRRTAEGLLRLREALAKQIPVKTIEETLLIASWNIREFGGTKQGGRTQESLFYIAEVIDHFDLVAVQEVRDNLRALDELMAVLGRCWKYLVTDVTLGFQGNGERLAFLYDERKLSFGGLAGEVAPEMVKDKDDGMLESEFAFSRSPYIVGFRAGWFKFGICTSHLYYGKSKPDDPQRAEELARLVKYLQGRIKSKDRWARNAILLGDFNIFTEKDEMFKKLPKAFEKPAAHKAVGTNAGKDKVYDQMLFLSPDIGNQLKEARAGVFDLYQYVYRDEDRDIFKQHDLKKYRQWRTYQMSDHLPLWAELYIDFGVDYLKSKADPARPQGAPPPIKLAVD